MYERMSINKAEANTNKWSVKKLAKPKHNCLHSNYRRGNQAEKKNIYLSSTTSHRDTIEKNSINNLK